MLFLILILAYPVLLIVILLPLNHIGMLPGTWRYRQQGRLRDSKMAVEIARSQAIVTRYRMKENEHLDRQLALEAPKE